MDGKAAAFEQKVKAGHVIEFGVNPAYFASSKEGAQLIRDIVKYAAGKAGVEYHESNTMKAIRGKYNIIQTLEEPATVQGKYIDLFDARLPIVTQKEIFPHSAAMLYDISGIHVKKPEILFTSGKITSKEEGKDRTDYTIVGPADSTASTRIASSKKVPARVAGTDSAGNAISVT